MSEFKYRAFLSYSHMDAKWGDWLHKALETYRVPRRLVGKESRDGKIPARLFPIFRDREELPVSADLPSNINDALRDSQYLIVVCSPRAAQSRWVGEEIKAFKKLGREDRILALIIDGEPNASGGKLGFAVEDECFPKMMRYRMGADGRLSSERTEPIAADAREGKDGKNNAKLKLLAGLLGINYDELKQREQERRIRRARAIGLSAIFLVGIFAVLAIALFLKAREARAQQAAAERAGSEARAQQLAAEHARDEAKGALSRSDFLQSLRSIDEDKALDALPQLARSLRFDPTNHAAACRLITLLTYREYPQLLLRVKHLTYVSSAQFSSNGDFLLTVSGDEVRVWNSQTGNPASKSMKHGGAVNSAQFSPDGKRIVTSSMDGKARIWNGHTGERLIDFIHRNAVNAAEFSPDGNEIVTASPGVGETLGEARVWDAHSGRLLGEPIKLNDAHSRYAHFSPDGKRIVWEGRIWDAKNGKLLTELSGVGSAQFSPDGRRVVATSDAIGVAQVWDMESGKPITKELESGGTNASAQFSPDGTRVITSGCYRGDCATQVWDSQTGAQLGVSSQGGAAEFSSDGRRFMTISRAKMRIWNAGWIRVEPGGSRNWDAETGKPITEPTTHSDVISSAHFSPDGTRIVVASGHEAQVWDLRRRKPLSETFDHEDVQAAQFSPDSKWVVTAGRRLLQQPASANARVWDAETCKPVTNYLPHGDWVEAKFSPDGKQIVTWSRDKTARVWNAETGDAVTSAIEHDDVVSSAEFSADGKRIITIAGGQAQIWDSQSGKPVGPQMKHDSVVFVQFSPNWRWILAVSKDVQNDEKLALEWRLWDAQTNKPLRQPVINALSVQFSPDSRRIVTASEQGDIQIRDVETGEPITKPASHGDYPYGGSAQYSPDGKRILTSGRDQMRIWDADTLQPVTEPIKAGSVARFSRDSKWIVSMASQIWDAETGKALSEPLNQNSSAVSSQFSSDAKRILTLSHRSSSYGIKTEARIWDVAPSGIAPAWLSRLADAIGGQHLNDRAVFEPLKRHSEEILEEIKSDLNRDPPADNSWTIWGRWFLADRSTRSISPFSKVMIPDYIQNRINENTAESLDDAEELALGNPELLSRIAAARKALSRTATP